jgi:hypothetical protein
MLGKEATQRVPEAVPSRMTGHPPGRVVPDPSRSYPTQRYYTPLITWRLKFASDGEE